MIDKRKPRFSCARCGSCCLEPGYVSFSGRERAGAARRLGITVSEFRKRYGGDMKGTEIRVTRRRRCPFLAEGGCVIYDARPAQCRAFPFWPEILSSRAAWNRRARTCRGMGKL
ncbi:MAG: YkgJ family cysteine cluster protein [Candidatus Eisenbacteria bacterium]